MHPFGGVFQRLIAVGLREKVNVIPEARETASGF